MREVCFDHFLVYMRVNVNLKNSEAHSEPSQVSKMDLLLLVNYSVAGVNYFHKDLLLRYVNWF